MSQATDNFTAAVQQLSTDVQALVAALNASKASVQAAVDVQAESDTVAVQAIDATVKAALGQ